MFNLGLASQGWNNLKKIAEDGWNGVKDVLTPSGGDLVRQVNIGGAGPAPSVVKVVEPVVTTIPDVVNIPDIIPDSWSKYGKYIKWGAIGGAALLAYSILKK